MAIDMTTVKKIMHNNKEVAKIEDGLGNVLWQKAAEPEWHTIYDNSSGYDMRLWSNKQWATTKVPCDISSKATKLRITYKAYCKGAYMRLSFNTSSNAFNATGSVTK